MTRGRDRKGQVIRRGILELLAQAVGGLTTTQRLELRELTTSALGTVAQLVLRAQRRAIDDLSARVLARHVARQAPCRVCGGRGRHYKGCETLARPRVATPEEVARLDEMRANAVPLENRSRPGVTTRSRRARKGK